MLTVFDDVFYPPDCIILERFHIMNSYVKLTRNIDNRNNVSFNRLDSIDTEHKINRVY